MKRLESFQNTRTRRRKAGRVLMAVVAAFLALETLHAFVAKSWTARSSSMEPSILPGDRLVVLRSAYGLPVPLSDKRFAFRDPKRGDVVLMHDPSAESMPWTVRIADAVLRFVTAQRLSLDRDRPVIKRVVAVPGDVVKMENFIVYVKASGSTHFLTEYEVSGRAYDLRGKGLPEGWNADMPLSGSYPETFLSDGQFFVVGDDRPASTDSRFFGPIDGGSIIGKVALRYWPVGRLSGF